MTRQRRGRAGFLWGVLLFAASQAALATTVQSRQIEWRDPAFTFKLERWQTRVARRAGPDGRPPVRVLMLGSSRTQLGLCAARAEAALDRAGRPRAAVFNFGHPGAGPVTQLLYLRRLLAAGPTPDLLLVEASPLFLAGHLPTPYEQIHLRADRLTPAERREAERLGLWFPSPPWFGGLAPACEMRSALLRRFAPDWLPDRLDEQQRERWMADSDASGWLVQAEDMPAAERRRLGEMARTTLAPVFTGYHVRGPAAQALRELLTLARERGVPTVLVRMPEAPWFQVLYEPAGLSEFGGLLAELSATFAAPLIDASDGVGEDKFLDGHHLDRAGAEAFTDRLTRDVLRPWLAGRPW